MLAIKTDESSSQKGLLNNLLKLDTNVKSDKFSLLLESFSFGKGGKNAVLQDLPKGLDKLELLSQVDAKEVKGTPSKSPLSQLFNLGSEEALEVQTEEKLFHPAVLKALPSQEIKQLITEAKNYLKEQITLKTDIKELPKTLGGLIKLAEKSGIDIKAISFESLTPTAEKADIAKILNNSKSLVPTEPTSLKTAQSIPHTTSELVKPVVTTKADKESHANKPLSLLLGKEGSIEEPIREALTTPKTSTVSSTLSALLHGDKINEKTDGDLSLKTEGEKHSDKVSSVLQTKTEQLSQKVTEAKQLVNHMAQNIKESVENYKPPFTRIKMQLNPQKFGEMDVTMVQRGNNVHININASTSALTLMMQNAHELKSALSAQGLGDATMNFSSHQHQQQQQEKQSQEQGFLSYEEYAELDEETAQIATALEVVIPRYI